MEVKYRILLMNNVCSTDENVEYKLILSQKYAIVNLIILV